MDKFGIFKILSSLKNNDNASFSQNKEETPNFNSDGINGIINILSSLLGFNVPPQLLNMISSKFNKKEEQTPPPKKPSVRNDDLLKAMKSHDDFIRRVQENNKKSR